MVNDSANTIVQNIMTASFMADYLMMNNYFTM